MPTYQPGTASAKKTETAGYEYPRYLFVNMSADIHRLCGEALDRLGVGLAVPKPTTHLGRPAGGGGQARRVRRPEVLTSHAEPGGASAHDDRATAYHSSAVWARPAFDGRRQDLAFRPFPGPQSGLASSSRASAAASTLPSLSGADSASSRDPADRVPRPQHGGATVPPARDRA